MNHNIWTFYLGGVISFAGVITFILWMMYYSSGGIVCVYEHNLLIRNIEILFGIFLVLTSIYIFNNIVTGKDEFRPSVDSDLLLLKSRVMSG